MRTRQGATAVEADVTFSNDGQPLYTYHGPPCDCWRHCNQQEDFDDYINFVREASIDTADGPGQNLTMLFLDLKLNPLTQQAKERAGQELAKSILNNLFVPGSQQDARARTFRLIVSINHVNDIDLVRHFIHTLEINNSSHLLSENIGFDVGMNDDLQLIESTWRKFATNGVNLNLWQGDGITNCLSPIKNLERLSRALTKRDTTGNYPAKVYHWTIDLHDRMRDSLLMGVDAIMTNHPERLMTVLQEPMLAHELRPATREDNPFQKLTTRRVSGRSNEATARYQRSVSAPKSGFVYSFIDNMASLLTYLREIPIFSYPTTLISRSTFTPSSKRNKLVVGKSAPTSPATVNLAPVRLQNGPEYRVMSSAKNDTQQLASRSLDNSTTSVQSAEREYEGPEWYTSLVSSVLISIMRILLPVN
jgi:glycerophosphoryl diester phosphodiesterase